MLLSAQHLRRLLRSEKPGPTPPCQKASQRRTLVTLLVLSKMQSLSGPCTRITASRLRFKEACLGGIRIFLTGRREFDKRRRGRLYQAGLPIIRTVLKRVPRDHLLYSHGKEQRDSELVSRFLTLGQRRGPTRPDVSLDLEAWGLPRQAARLTLTLCGLFRATTDLGSFSC